MFGLGRRRGDFRDLARRIAKLRHQGRHVYSRDWHCRAEDDIGELAALLLQWCRDVLAGSRRPYGIDYFDLRLVAGGAGPRARLDRAQLRPGSLYAASLEAEVLVLLHQGWRSAGGLLSVSVSLFSWGDAAHSLLPPPGLK
jgi:hypothetical protein